MSKDIRNPMYLDPNFDGACPCSKFEENGIKIETHCWRSTCELDHEFSCVHYSPNTPEALKLARETADYIKMAYHSDVEVAPHE